MTVVARAVAAVVVITPAWCAAGEPSRFEFARPRMGTIVRLVFYCRSEALANKAADAAYARIDALNAALSDYDPESELNRLRGRRGPQRVGPELFAVLSEANRVSRSSNGAFDVTVAPVVKLWRRARRRRELPDETRLREAISHVGWRNVKLDACRRTVQLLDPETQLDLGGIAKGYVGDEVLRELRKHGIARAMVDAGGDLVLGDPPPNTTGWSIALASQDSASDTPPERLRLANLAVATSGDAFRFVEIDGIRYSHIVDPRTGLGLTTRSTVTVIAPSGMLADAYASAVSVLGPRRGRAFIEKRRGVEARIVTSPNAGSRSTWRSTGFPSSVAN